MPKTETPSPHEGERIAKVMARAGLCSRRDAERWIADGRVSVNGAVLRSPAVNITVKDTVLVDGAPLPEAERTRLWRYHKPAGLVVSHRDPQGRPTVFEKMPPGFPRVVSVGRLDFSTEGLLLLTNDGELERNLELPANGWIRRYRVRAYGSVDAAALAKLKDGVTVDGVKYGSIEASLERVQGGNVWLTFALKEGRNREVKRVCEHLGLQVNRLIRVAFGPFVLGDMERGAIEEVPRKMLKEQLGRHLGGGSEARGAHRRR